MSAKVRYGDLKKIIYQKNTYLGTFDRISANGHYINTKSLCNVSISLFTLNMIMSTYLGDICTLGAMSQEQGGDISTKRTNPLYPYNYLGWIYLMN